MALLPRLLIVDDELGVRESLRAILGSEYDVLTASNGPDALEIVRREPIDVVTLDLRMPGQGGISVLEAIKSHDPDIEVLIITGYGSFDTAVQGLRHHAFDYLAKPFDCDHVRRVLQAALARRFATKRMRDAPQQFLSSLSHEFRTPLNIIMGYSTMMEEEGEGDLSPEQRLALDRIQMNSEALLSYVETLFYLIELDRDQIPGHTGPVRIAEILGRVRAELSRQATERGMTVAVDAPVDLVFPTDADKLLRLVRALAENALRHVGSGIVTLAAHRSADGLTIEVRDAGKGLPPEVVAEAQHVVADRPHAAPPRRLGFGLRLVGRIVRSLGGAFAATSGTDGGCCVVAIPEGAPPSHPRIANDDRPSLTG